MAHGTALFLHSDSAKDVLSPRFSHFFFSVPTHLACLTPQMSKPPKTTGAHIQTPRCTSPSHLTGTDMYSPSQLHPEAVLMMKSCKGCCWDIWWLWRERMAEQLISSTVTLQRVLKIIFREKTLLVIQVLIKYFPKALAWKHTVIVVSVCKTTEVWT